MNITLYYVPGINETDTPVFDTLAHQAAFFADCEKKVISTGFYPPFLHNTIKLDVDDYNLVTSVWNYLSIDYGTKTFYYFVNRKRYVNEYIVEVDIDMDTVQTYMFDVHWIHSHIVKKSIPRWKRLSPQSSTWLINRDYIREDYSTRNFNKYVQYNLYNSDYSQWMFIARGLKTVPQSITTEFKERAYITVKPGSSDLTYVYKDFGFLFIEPFNDSSVLMPLQATTNCKYYLFSYDILSATNVVDAYVIPFNPFQNTTIYESGSVGSGNWVLDCTNETNAYADNLDDGTAYIRVQEETQYKIYKNTVSLNFERSTVATNAFNIKYIPALIDESYILCDFGNYSKRTEYPLHILTGTSLTTYHWANLTSGDIYFNIGPTGNLSSGMDNYYHTTVATNVPLKLEMRNDAWKEWQARNIATLGGALLNSVKVAASMAMGGSGISSMAESTSDIMGKTRGRVSGMFKPVTQHHTISENVIDSARQSATTNRGISLNASPNGLIDYAITATNLRYAPSTIASKGTYHDDLLAYEPFIYSQVFYCSNIQEAAYIYESTGYKVSEESTGNLFQTSNRYYYDCVQTEDMNIELGAMDLERDIIARFNSGLRLWHTTNGVLNCKLVTGVTLNMGQVCVYDNVEV